MLAPSPRYLTAKKLRITEVEHHALIAVMRMLRSGDIAPWPKLGQVSHAPKIFRFDRWFERTNCTTVGCIAGHAFAYSRGDAFADYIRGTRRRKCDRLFFPPEHIKNRCDPIEIANGIESFLTTGNPYWALT